MPRCGLAWARRLHSTNAMAPQRFGEPLPRPRVPLLERRSQTMSLRGRTASEGWNICFVTPEYARDERDGRARGLRETIRRLSDRGHRVTVCAPSERGLPSHVIDGVPVHRFRYAPKSLEFLTREDVVAPQLRYPLHAALRMAYVVRGTRAAKALGKRAAFDIVHVDSPCPHASMAFAAAKANGAAVVASVSGGDLVCLDRSDAVRRALSDSVRRCHAVLASHHHAKHRIEEVAGRSAEVFTYGFDAKPAAESTTKNLVPRVLFYGDLVEDSGLDSLLRSAAFLVANRPCRFLIGGSGPSFSKLQMLVRILHLEPFVEFVGPLSDSQLRTEIARCDVVVDPSITADRSFDFESAGVFAPIHSSHKPIIATDASRYREAVVHGRTGWLVPAGDAQALGRAILDLINHPSRARKFGTAGHDRLQGDFAWKRVIEGLERTYAAAITEALTPSHPIAEWIRGGDSTLELAMKAAAA